MRKILTILVALVLMAAPAMALEPCPIAVKFVTSPPEANVGLTVDLVYSGSVISSGMTNEYGEIIIDVGDQGIPNCGSQNFAMVVRDCESNSLCHRTVSFNPYGFTTVDLTSVDLFYRATTTTVAPTTTTTIEAPSCGALGFILPEDCPGPSEETVMAIIASLIIAAGAGFGYKSYISKSGQLVKMHKHYGIVGYHSPGISHLNKSIRHPKGMIFPKYVNGKYAGG